MLIFNVSNYKSNKSIVFHINTMLDSLNISQARAHPQKDEPKTKQNII